MHENARHASKGGQLDELRAILEIGHDTSMRGEGLSLRDALARSEYQRIRQGFEAEDLVPILVAEPDLVRQWLIYSEDKRTSGGWYLAERGEVGRVGLPQSVERFPSMAEAVAAYVVRELDFWVEVDTGRT